MTDCLSVEIQSSFKNYDLAAGHVGLFFFVCDKDGYTLFKSKLSYKNGTGIEIIEVPANAAHLCLAFRLEGEGMIEGPSLEIKRLFKEKRKTLSTIKAVPTKKDASSSLPKQGMTLADQIARCVQERNFNAGIALVRSVETPSDSERKQLLQCYANLHEFKEVLLEYHRLSHKGKLNPDAKLFYLRALVNLGFIKEAEKFIMSACLELSEDKRNFSFLASTYPFTVSISDDLAHMVRAKLVVSSHQFTKKNFDLLLRCAHDLVEEKEYRGFYDLIQISSLFDLSVEQKAKLDILSSHIAHIQKHYDLSLIALNRAITLYGATPLKVDDTKSPLKFETVSSPQSIRRSVRGPLTSVMMTSFNSEKTIEYALRSLMAQTYADLEIIVIDDCSTDNTQKIVQSLILEDNRIRFIPLDTNGGTYVAKNQGLKNAKGQYITCQDSDDWAHPQKIERMVSTLENDKALMAVSVYHVRYDPKRGFQSRSGYVRPDASSMMYRKKEVTERLGFYDSVRVGADSEFQYRFDRVFGKSAFKRLPELLSLVLWSEASLSGGGKFAIDDDAGVFSPHRNAYRRAFCHWQEKAESLYIPFPITDRHFEVPGDMLPKATSEK